MAEPDPYPGTHGHVPRNPAPIATCKDRPPMAGGPYTFPGPYPAPFPAAEKNPRPHLTQVVIGH